MKLQIYKNAKLRETWIGFIEWGDWIVFLPTDLSKPTVVPKPDATDSEECEERVEIDEDGNVRAIGEKSPPSAEDSKSEPDGQ
ncbi:hypothetical protein LCGC14_1018390 [marine sediment metagenome]|uniref:Uncharacterized protein n=1 Tax=marine sediment metagenome TaxID=412755 RepID=A0A0F9NJQ4_9ZZZZ